MAAEANERAQRSVPGTVTVTFAESNSALVALRGEWDISTQPQLAEALQRSRGRQNVVIELSDCSFLDSTTIGMLITLDRELAASGGRLEVALPPSQNVVNRAFALLGIREVLSVHDTLEAAQRSLPTARAATPSAWRKPSRPMPVD
jgi:anti-sigma B factor antagonist